MANDALGKSLECTALVSPRPLTSTSSWRPCRWQVIHSQWSTLPSHNCLRLQTLLQGDTLAQDLSSLCVAEARYLWFQKWVRWGNEGSTFRPASVSIRVERGSKGVCGVAASGPEGTLA